MISDSLTDHPPVRPPPPPLVAPLLHFSFFTPCWLLAFLLLVMWKSTSIFICSPKVKGCVCFQRTAVVLLSSMTAPSMSSTTSGAFQGSSAKPTRAVTQGLAGMRVRGRALVCCLTVLVQSRAFRIAPPIRGAPLASRARASAAAPPLMAYDVRYSPNVWKDEGEIKPGFGGIWPGDPDAETHHVREMHAATAVVYTSTAFYHVLLSNISVSVSTSTTGTRSCCSNPTVAA